MPVSGPRHVCFSGFGKLQRRPSTVHEILYGSGVRKPVQNSSLERPVKFGLTDLCKCC